MRSIVNFESLYGINYLLVFLSVNEEITFPKVNRDLLIYPVSLTISPLDCDSFNLSLPAKSTKEIFPYLLSLFPSE